MTLDGAGLCQPVLLPFPSGVAWAHGRGCRLFPGQKVSPSAPWHDSLDGEEGGEDVSTPPDVQDPEGTERASSSENRGARDRTARVGTSSRLASVQRITRRHAAETRRTGLDEAIRRHPSATLAPVTDKCPAHPSFLWWECPTCSEREAG